MTLTLDHIFICTAEGAPEAEDLVSFGFREGAPNVHPGQGTANRRFFFWNAMLELLWVHDKAAAQSPEVLTARLWERWSQRHSGACPFGVIVRPAGSPGSDVAFAARDYRPQWLPPDQHIYIGEASIEEPMWVYMPFLRRPLATDRERHPNSAGEISRVIVTAPVPWASTASEAMLNAGIGREDGPEHLLTLEFDGGAKGRSKDFRPRLPLRLRL